LIVTFEIGSERRMRMLISAISNMCLAYSQIASQIRAPLQNIRGRATDPSSAPDQICPAMGATPVREARKSAHCAKTLRFLSLLTRSKIDFGHFDPMFRPKLIWVEPDSRQSAAGQRSLPAPELP
jgi:hypothetical protein